MFVIYAHSKEKGNSCQQKKKKKKKKSKKKEKGKQIAQERKDKS